MDQAAQMMLLVLMPSMDDIDISTIQRGDQSQGVQILGADAAGGQSGADTAPTPSKSKGKVVRTICSDDDVSSDDDIPLQMDEGIRQWQICGR
jgi:hypothetical protein